MPMMGCPGALGGGCVYCDQLAVTGVTGFTLDSIYNALEAQLLALPPDPDRPHEVAFYGGTFTGLPAPWPARLLDLCREHGVARVRCSTRPDRADPAQLADLAQQGLTLVELGAQSFDDAVLDAAGRGYSGETVDRAVRTVRAASPDRTMGLGLQLMPGLPGMDPALFTRDVERAVACKPDLVRLYPCQVLSGTPLARMWEEGSYRPWTLEETVDALAGACLAFWEAGVRVVRMGLPEEPGLAAARLAGPHHPALGQMVRSEALSRVVTARAASLDPPPTRLLVPRRHQGEVFGHRGALRPCYAALGLVPAPTSGDLFILA